MLRSIRGLAFTLLNLVFTHDALLHIFLASFLTQYGLQLPVAHGVSEIPRPDIGGRRIGREWLQLCTAGSRLCNVILYITVDGCESLCSRIPG